MNDDDDISCYVSFLNGKFTECCDLLQRTFDERRLNEIGAAHDEIEFIKLRNNLLVCNCLRNLSEMSEEYVGKMTEFINVSKLYLYEKHVPMEMRVNFVCNTLHWYWLKPVDIPDYCYKEIITLVDECLHQVLQETSGRSSINLSTHVGVEQDIVNILERLSNKFFILKPLLVVQCLEISQLLMLVFLSRRCFASVLVNFTIRLLDQIKTIMSAFKHYKSDCIARCFKLGLSKINVILSTSYVKTIVVSGHISLSIKQILENEHRQALSTLSTVDRYLDQDDKLFGLVCYLKALGNFNSDELEVALYYLSQTADCSMEPFIKSRCYLLLGRTHSKMGNNDMAINAFEKLQKSAFNRIMAYYMSQHYERNNMQFMQIMVLEQVIKEDFCRIEGDHQDFSISYTSKVLNILHPQPDLTGKQLLYLAAKKKFEHSSYKLAASNYLNLIRTNDVEQYVSDLVTIPSTFMLKHEAAVALLKAHEMEEAFKLCRSLIEDFVPGCELWKSDSFWAIELNNYDFNVVGTMLLAETGFDFIQNADFILETLNKSFNCLYAKICCDHSTTEVNICDERIKTLRQILIGKILLLKAVVLSKLNNDENCEATFKKALTYNSGDEDIVYLYSKWLEHKGKISQSMEVRSQFDQSKINSVTCDSIVMTHVLENKHGLEDTIMGGTSIIDDLFANSDDNAIDVDMEMDPADDDVFNDLFLD